MRGRCPSPGALSTAEASSQASAPARDEHRPPATFRDALALRLPFSSQAASTMRGPGDLLTVTAPAGPGEDVVGRSRRHPEGSGEGADRSPEG